MKQLAILFLILFSLTANTKAQNQATLQGKVTEKTSGDDAINAYVRFIKNGITKLTVATDFEGNYSASVDAGMYDVEITYVGMETYQIRKVELLASQTTKLDVQLYSNSTISCGIICRTHYPPLIHQDDTTSGATYNAQQIGRSPR
jgi:uncharacterized membrane protein